MRRLVFGVSVVFVGLTAAWAQERPQRRMTIPAPVNAIAFAEDGGSVVAWDPGGYSIWSIDSGRVTRREPVFAKACGRTAALPRSEDGLTVGVNCRGKLLFFEMATGRSLGEWTLGDGRASVAFAVAPDGAFAAVVMAGALGSVEVLDRAGKRQATLKATQELERVSIARDGRHIAAGSSAGVTIWSMPEGRSLATIEGRAAHAFSPDGRSIAVVGDRGVAVHSVADGAPIRQLEGGANEVRFGRRQLVGWTNQQVVVWDAEAGAQRLVLKSDQFVSAAASGDGSRLGTVSLELRGDAAASILAIWSVPAGSP